MADIRTLKGFIKDSAGNIILPISRGELIFDANGNIALHSEVFKAEAATRYTQAEITAEKNKDPNFNKTIKDAKPGTGKYGLMTPEDLLDLHEALARITIIEAETGISGEGDGNNESLKELLQKLIEKVGNLVGEEIGADEAGNKILAKADTGIYKYINDRILAHLALSDALKYQGTLGTNGSITALPTEAADINNGDTYKVTTAGAYVVGKNEDGSDKKINAKPGDLFIALYDPDSETYSWDYIPSGNELETFIKIEKNIKGEDINQALSGTIEFSGSNGISIRYDETNKKVIISGVGGETQILLEGIYERLTNLETTVNGRAESGTRGEEDYVAPVVGLTTKTNFALDKINNAVDSWDEIVEKVKDEEGKDTAELKNGDALVKASAVYDVTKELATHIAVAEGKYLLAETMELTTPLTAAQKAYLTGTITN